MQNKQTQDKKIPKKQALRLRFKGKRRFKVNREVKDRLFRFLFAQDREALLQLYNALNRSDYQDPQEPEIVTINNIVYMAMKNDLAFIISGTLNLYEHQSTYNPNMPLRFFLYLGQEFQKLLAQRGEDLYGSALIRLPAPQCVVFYNGDREEQDRRLLKLSDAFVCREKECGVELTAWLININFGHNKELMERCHRLWEYSYFVSQVKERLRKGMSVKESVDGAVRHCVREDVLADFLEQHRMEVTGMLLEEYDEKKTMKYLQKEAREIGRQEGFSQGIEKGIEKGIEQGSRALIGMCRELALSPTETRRRLKSDLGLTEEAITLYMNKFWNDEPNCGNGIS